MRILFALTLLIYSVHIALTGQVIKLSPEYYHPIESLYHSQTNAGHYLYGYATPTITRSETKSADGVTQGGYSYIDADGRLQTVQYTADALHGFRVAASNLPTETADVAHARASHLAEFEAIRAERAKAAAAAVAAATIPYFNPVAVPHTNVPELAASQQLPQPVADLPEVVKAREQHLAALHAAYRDAQAAQLGYGLPQPVQDLPEVVKARAEHLAVVEQERTRQAQLRAEVSLSPIPDNLSGHVVPIQTQVDGSQPLPIAEAPQLTYAPEPNIYAPYSYGYVGPHSSQSESQSANGVVQGGYSYIDAFGIVQTVNYIADKAGFRVSATNLPVDKNHHSAHSTAPSRPIIPARGRISNVEEKKANIPALYTANINY